MYDRGDASAARQVLDWDSGTTWIAHPDEGGRRASHALRGADGVWVLDPVDAPNVDGIVAEVGEVVGVAVLTSWHARDAGTVARRHGVAVHVPEWLRRVEPRVRGDAPVERYTLAPGGSGFRTIPCRPFPLWDETFLYDETSGTLVVPDSMATTNLARIDDERLGLQWFRRPQPPEQLRGLEPDRILVGHGEPVTDDPATALESALDGARRSFLRATVENGPESFRSLTDALRG